MASRSRSKQAKQLDPSGLIAPYNLGLLYIEMNMLEEALAELEFVNRRESTYKKVRERLDYVKRRMKVD